MQRINDIPFNQNTYLVETKKGLIIIDPGFQKDDIIKTIGNKKPVAVLLTHFHFDHIASLNEICDKYNIKAYIHKDGKKHLLEDTLFKLFGYTEIKVDSKHILTFTNKIPDFTDVEIIHTPGHCEGLVTFKINNELFTGDFIFKDSIGRTDLPSSDPLLMKESLKIVKEWDDSWLICPGHGEAVTLKELKEANPFIN